MANNKEKKKDIKISVQYAKKEIRLARKEQKAIKKQLREDGGEPELYSALGYFEGVADTLQRFMDANS